MPPAIDLTGQRFGRLVVVERLVERSNYLSPYWVCKCDCGNEARVLIGNLRNGNSTSCGCGRKEAALASNTTHGMRHTSEYKIWLGIKVRCYNEKHHSYENYGAKGITMSDSWRKSFEAFYRDMGPRPSSKHSVERRENNKGYSKDNCYWATTIEQGNNRRNNILYERNGETKTLAEWCRLLGRKYRRVYYRMKRDGWSFEKAIDTPT